MGIYLDEFLEYPFFLAVAALCVLFMAYLGLRQLGNWFAGLRSRRRKHRSRDAHDPSHRRRSGGSRSRRA